MRFYYNKSNNINREKDTTMLTKRIIPCLDVKDGQTVKGVNFKNFKFAGDPIELAKKYSQEGADEIVFLDITATNEGRKTTLKMLRLPILQGIKLIKT